MKAFALATFAALLATSAIAAPSAKVARQPLGIQITFHGATPSDTVTQFFPDDCSTQDVGKYTCFYPVLPFRDAIAVVKIFYIMIDKSIIGLKPC